MFKVLQTQRLRWRIPPALAAFALLLLLVGPPRAWSHAVPYDVAVTVVCFPVLLLLSARSQPAVRFAGFFQGLGIASYAIYILHVPLAGAYFAAMGMVLGAERMQALRVWETVGLITLIFAAALLVDKVYDGPVRRVLRARLEGRA